MARHDYPVLCGGIFFTLKLVARKQRTAKRDNIKGDTDGLSQPELLIELAKIIKPSFNPPIKASTLKKNVGEYRQCDNNGGSYFAAVFETASDISSFNERVINDYDSVLSAMSALTNRFIDRDKGEWIAKALLDIIAQDQSIDEGQVFQDANKSTKKQLRDISDIHLPAFLLAVWHYIVMNVGDNTLGKATFTKWHKKKGGPNSEWIFGSSIGENIKRKINISFPDSNPPTIPCNINEDFTSSSVHYSKEMYKVYFDNIEDKHGSVRNLLYDKTPVPFYDFYINNDIVLDYAVSSTKGISYKAHRPRGPGEEIVPLTAEYFTSGKASSENNYYKISLDLLLENYHFAIITGMAGIGKSMTMYHLELSAARRYDELGVLPVFLPLKQYAWPDEKLFDWITSITGNQGISKEHLIEKLSAGQCMLLFDGWDEVHRDAKQKLKRDLESLTDRFPGSYFYISSRPDDRFISFERFHILKLLPFTFEQALEFVDKIVYRSDEPLIKQKFKDELNSRLFITHKEFAENPLLLTIMLMRFGEYGSAPAKMHVFYEEAFSVLAKRHDADKGLDRAFRTGLSKDGFKKYFSEFCFRTYKDERFSFTEDEFKEYFSKIDAEIDAEDFLYDISYNLCMLFQEGRAYHFIHRSFQEYFSAIFIIEQENKHYHKLVDFFERHYDGTKSDNTLAMLYDMRPQLVETFIIMPFLENLMEECGRNDGYWHFLRLIYSGFYYLDVTFADDKQNDPDSNLYGFIREKLTLPDEIIYQLPPCKDFIDETYYTVETVELGEIIITDREWNPIPTEDGDLLLDVPNYSSETVQVIGDTAWSAGESYYVYMSKLLAGRDKYGELMQALNNDMFVFKAEYIATHVYLEDIKRRQRRTDDSVDDLFS
jgi:hypothetical protein